MKRFSIVILTVLLLLCFAVSAYAEESEAVQPLPKIIVTDYKIDGGSLAAGQTCGISITIKNMSPDADAKNLKISFSDPGGSILPAEINSAFVARLSRKQSYTWTFDIEVSEKASTGKHAVTVTTEYESASGQAGSASDSITLDIINIAPVTKVLQPRLMVTGYTVDNGSIAPNESTALRIKIKNTSSAVSVSNIKFSFTEEKGEIKPDGIGTAYVKSIGAGESYEWVLQVSASHTAATGEHTATVTIEYEDGKQTQYSVSDTVRLAVRQSVKLDYSGAQLPAKVIQGETPTVGINLMNMGKSTLYNCLISFDIPSLECGGSVLVGTINSGESKQGSANLRVASSAVGSVSGTITITYEDEFGESYEEAVPVSTVIEEKVEAASVQPKEEEKKNTLWWLFALIGVIVGGAAGFGIPFAIRSSKQRKEDEKRL